MEVSDEKIIKLCKHNDVMGFNSLYSKYQNYIYRLCYYYTNSKQDSLDLLQDVYIKLYKSIYSFDESKPLVPWIKRITINTCHNFLRDNKIVPSSLNSRLSSEEELQNTLKSNDNVEDTIDYVDTKKALEKAIRSLPSDIKTVIILRHIEGLSYKEISDLVSIPIGTVKTYLFRGRKSIKDILIKEGIWEV